MDLKTLGVIVLALIVSVVIVGTRWQLGEEYQVTLTDLAVFVTPILIWLIVTNRISELTLGKEGVTIKAAAKRSVQKGLSRISVREITIAEKGMLEDIPNFIDQKIEALKLQVNRHNFYDEYALRQYLKSAHPIFILSVRGHR